MALIVQKFGGTSVGSLERIDHVANKIIQAKSQGHTVVVVTSAMNGETDRLIHLANTVCEKPDSREYDTLIATGEQVAIALLSMTLINKGHRARSYLGGQVRITTNAAHKKARIMNIGVEKLQKDLQTGII